MVQRGQITLVLYKVPLFPLLTAVSYTHLDVYKRQQFYFRTTDVTGTIHLGKGVEVIMPGDNAVSYTHLGTHGTPTTNDLCVAISMLERSNETIITCSGLMAIKKRVALSGEPCGTPFEILYLSDNMPFKMCIRDRG